MNVLFLTQSNSLSVFYDVALEMRGRGKLNRAGFYVADSRYFDRFCSETASFSPEDHEMLKEWEVLRRAASTRSDLDRLREYEERLGDPVLWNALVADRRVYLGPRATIEQDYAGRFGHDSMLAISQVAIEEMEALFDRLKPDLVVGFICVTLGDYLGYLVAKSRGIRFVNLRPTRIRNYFFGGEDIFEPSGLLEACYRKFLAHGVPEDLREEAASYLKDVRGTHAMYEGVIPASGPVESAAHAQCGLFGKLLRLGGMWLDQVRGKYRFDSHYDQGVIYPEYFNRMKRPLRARRIEWALRGSYLADSELEALDYAFYPLHKEPEVTLLVYSRAYLNQIEVVRNLARSLPVGMKLVVKEHPAGVGYRKLGYYRKLLEIPNVRLVPPSMRSRTLVNGSRFVAVISGSIGLEALIMKKPVLALGGAPFTFLPDSMVRRAGSPVDLPEKVKELLGEQSYDESAMLAYVAAVMNESVALDFYSVLLARRGVYSTAKGQDRADVYRENVEALTSFLSGRG